ncbi:MAG: peptidase M16 [Pseudopedobacter saltans]|uniref:Peptidase M16 n=1 Tax=Pseudopedobacter saltans TaxID=151895 RepID=A0A2W5H7C3_9SPHI|nr:MAG: peptidase M16 [Pseudopedobacter saltans]
MIQFNRFILDNGLRVIVHEDDTSPMSVVNIMYNVGARNEDEEHTGFAHLFEHLMFGGSTNIPDFDEPLQRVGGENNAYTTNDLTNYYEQLPSANLETALWLESDRMLSLDFNQKSLDVQRKVVSEEFKEHYINKPYGDLAKIVREQSYEKHPYRWMTIGKELAHIENATLEDVKSFFYEYYRPDNAILVVAGNVKTEDVRQLVEKWFGDIPRGTVSHHSLPMEPQQSAAKRISVEKDVPVDVLVKSWHMVSRLDPDYYATDLLTDILGGGASSRLYQKLVKENQFFSSIDCSHTGSVDAGLVSVQGKLVKGISIDVAEAAVDKEIKKIAAEKIAEKELEKVKNKTESMMAFEDLGLMSRASNLAFYELLGNVNLINTELDLYQNVTTDDILRVASTLFRESNSNTVHYLSKQNQQNAQ